jgi:hypothetical protein
VPPVLSDSPLVNHSDFLKDLLQQGASLPPPAAYPRCFHRTVISPLLDEVIQHMLQQGLLRPCPDIKAAFRLFFVAKTDWSARPILDLSPWTQHYQLPPMRLYSAAEVLTAIPPAALMIKIDLASGFFHFTKFYGVYYAGARYAFTRLPMGHALAPSIMQRASQAVAAHLYSTFQVHMCAYLDDWLLWDIRPHQVQPILLELQALGFTLNLQKSSLQPVTSLIYLGLQINTVARTITPTRVAHHRP